MDARRDSMRWAWMLLLYRWQVSSGRRVGQSRSLKTYILKSWWGGWRSFLGKTRHEIQGDGTDKWAFLRVRPPWPPRVWLRHSQFATCRWDVESLSCVVLSTGSVPTSLGGDHDRTYAVIPAPQTWSPELLDRQQTVREPNCEMRKRSKSEMLLKADDFYWGLGPWCDKSFTFPAKTKHSAF